MVVGTTIVHLITGLNTGGAEMMLYKLLSGIDRRRFRNVVVSLLGEGPLTAPIRALGVPVHPLDMRRGRPSPAAMARLLRLLRRERPAVLQTWLYHADLLGALVAPLAGATSLVWNIRSSNMDMSQYRRLSAWTIRACAGLSPRPRAVVVNSAAGRDFHARIGYRPREWVLIPNGIDTSAFRPDPEAHAALRRELGLKPEDILIGQIARFDPMKDHRTFLQAAALLRLREPGAHFLLAGRDVTPDNPALRAVIAATDLGANVHLLGERRDVARLTAALDIAASSSAYGEGFPTVMGEAMACAVPCVATDVGDAAIVVGDTGRVVAPRDPQALADAWSAILEAAPEGRAELGRRARARVIERFALGKIVGHYEMLYSRVAMRGMGPQASTVSPWPGR